MLAAALTVTEQPLRLLLSSLLSSHERPPKTEEAGEEDDRKVFFPFLGSERKQLVVTERLSTGRGRAPLVLSEVGSLNILLTRASRIKEGEEGKAEKKKEKQRREEKKCRIEDMCPSVFSCDFQKTNRRGEGNEPTQFLKDGGAS